MLARDACRRHSLKLNLEEVEVSTSIREHFVSLRSVEGHIASTLERLEVAPMTLAIGLEHQLAP